jgi:hypothetical protein
MRNRNWLILAGMVLSGLLSGASAQTYTFQYDRDSTDVFHQLSYTGVYDPATQMSDVDFSLYGPNGRSSFFFHRGLPQWLRAHSGATITSATMRGFIISNWFVAGPINYTAALYNFTDNLMFWLGTMADETAGWLNLGYTLDSSLLHTPPPPVTQTGSMTASLTQTTYDFEVTTLVQYAQQHADQDWGFVFITTGGARGWAPWRWSKAGSIPILR